MSNSTPLKHMQGFLDFHYHYILKQREQKETKAVEEEHREEPIIEEAV